MAIIRKKERVTYRYETAEEKFLAEQLAAVDVTRGFEYEKPRTERNNQNMVVVVRNTRLVG